MGKFFILMIMVCAVQICKGQTGVARKNKITSSVTENYNTVIVADRELKQGQYQALYNKKVVLAQGKYLDDKKVGTWRFFDKKQRLAQVYNYDTGKLIFEAPEDSTSSFRYEIDRKITDTTAATKPLKEGGRYFGYLPYLRFFKMPADLQGYSAEDVSVIVELYISPMGRVADFKMRVVAPYYNRVLSFDPGQLYPQDQTFLPATFNAEPISSRILISCYINRHGELDMDTGN